MCGIGPLRGEVLISTLRGDSATALSAKRAEARDRAGGDIEHARRAVLEHEADDLGDVVDIDVIAALLAFAEQHDGLAAIGLAAEFVRSIAVVRIAGAVNQRRPQDRERRRAAAAEQHLFARQMHGAVQARRRGRRGFGQRQRAVGIDRVGTHIDEMRDRPLGQSLAHRRHHADIFQHHRGRLARRARRHHRPAHRRRAAASRVVAPALVVEQIELLAAEPEHALACAAELAQDRAADKAAGAENDRARGRSVERCCDDRSIGSGSGRRRKRRHAERVIGQARRGAGFGHRARDRDRAPSAPS